MRFFKLNRNLNFKYIIGEILLLFIGINLAIWFNNWNASKKTNEDKRIALSKIIEEMDNNKLEIDSILINNQNILKAYRDYKGFYDGNTSVIKMSPKQFSLLKKMHPDFFRVKDSTATDDGLVRYNGTTYVNLEITTLTEIAWNTTTTLNVSNEFNYECLYELESLYNLQRRVQNEIDKSANALQKRELEELMHILEFLEQLGSQLQESYNTMQKNINNCS
ncbi:DUF6090 family protein [Pontimicrobium sp. SW4]|uniref:DUF6090 family protein n=1 Tax=Pontimicrobium sp. SW4 TaxID=3153519 RepID=A0AAU7BVF5_9FLAO